MNASNIINTSDSMNARDSKETSTTWIPMTMMEFLVNDGFLCEFLSSFCLAKLNKLRKIRK